jgi:hypothetical protein
MMSLRKVRGERCRERGAARGLEVLGSRREE